MLIDHETTDTDDLPDDLQPDERSRAEGVGAVVAGVGLMGAYVWLVMFSPISAASLAPNSPRVGAIVSVLVTFPMLIPTIASLIHGVEILTKAKLIECDAGRGGSE